ncbi:hypothetical protein ATCC90586_011462 [Pythium insidiosum]|nr:hypothetical protein ATCC90586_011462 [Pythium insidiosum]
MRVTRLVRLTRVATHAAARQSLRTPMAPAVAASCSPLLAALPASRTFSKAAGKKAKGKSDKQPAPSSDSAAEDAEQAVAVLLEKAKKNMNGAVLQFTRTLAQMRPGRADAGMFDELHVPAYGQHVPLSQVAQVSVSGSHAVTVNIYDPSVRGL